MRQAVQPMIVECGGCGTRFHMNPALFRGASGVRVRCRRCGERFKVLNPEAPQAPSPTVEQAVPAVPPGIDAEPTTIPETAGAATPESAAEPAPGPDAAPSPGSIAETAAPSEPETGRKAPFEGPALEQGEAVPWAEPTHPDIPPWQETGADPDVPPGSAPAVDAETAASLSITEGRPAEEAARVRRPEVSDRSGPRWGIVLLAAFGILLLGIGVVIFRDADSARDMLRGLFRLLGEGGDRGKERGGETGEVPDGSFPFQHVADLEHTL